MHVSPFMEMDVDYDWRFNSPDERLTVHMGNARGGRKIFDATLVLRREENRTDLAYAMVLDRLPVGGTDPNTALVVQGGPPTEAGALWWHAGCWWWESATPTRVGSSIAM